jgi:hypothetical protein
MHATSQSGRSHNSSVFESLHRYGVAAVPTAHRGIVAAQSSDELCKSAHVATLAIRQLQHAIGAPPSVVAAISIAAAYPVDTVITAAPFATTFSATIGTATPFAALTPVATSCKGGQGEGGKGDGKSGGGDGAAAAVAATTHLPL